ncbi:hypothetical protein GCM10007052_10080 [Halioglobus japonicus]|uniref:AsmA family protein n=1 Tax=Halioglobus japonicus TaxID=930805 RepID=UPI001675F6B2|nr:AsmA family protein [Halioglobus japonicus]GHD10923.1 hypothetical protein GCM10007052_10080 [Halioglobus japonicus]
MRKLLIVALLLSVLLALPLLAMRSERTLAFLAHWAVDTFTDYRLKLVSPVLRPFERNVSAAEIHVYPEDNDAPPFLTVLDFEGNIGWTDLYTTNLVDTRLKAQQVILYTSDTDSTSDPAPREWLKYIGWLPAELSIGQFHLVTAREEVFIFPLENVKGGRPNDQTFLASARAQYEGEPLDLNVGLNALLEEGHITAVKFNGEFSAPVSNSVVQLRGDVHGTADSFNYDLQLNADYADVSEFLRGFNARGELEGRLLLQAQMRGDADGFVLSNALFTLDNMPAYGIEAAGTLDYDISGGGELRLDAAGEISSMDVVLDWLDVDLHSLGRASGNAVITGTVRNPMIDRFMLRSEADSGLVVNAIGRVDPFRMGDAENKVRLDVAGPSIATLEQWTGPLPFEPGAFSASGLLVGRHGSVSLRDLVVEVGDPDELIFRLTGSAGSLDGMDSEGIAAARDLDLTLSVDSPDSRYLGEMLDIPIPAGFVLDGELTLKGTGAILEPVNGLFTARSPKLDFIFVPHAAKVTPMAHPVITDTLASVAITLDDVSALSEYIDVDIPARGRLDGKAELTQYGERLALNNLKMIVDGNELQLWATGEVDHLVPLDGIKLKGRFSDIPTARILNRALDGLDYQKPLGMLSGRFTVDYSGGKLNIPSFTIESDDKQGPLLLTVSGKSLDITGRLNVQSDIDYRLRDPDLLEALTGLRMNPLQGQGKIQLSPSEFVLSHTGEIGDSVAKLDARASLSAGKLTGLTAALNSPLLYLSDLGLQAEVAAEGYSPVEKLDRAEPRDFIEHILGRRASMPTDLRVNFGGISGKRTNINRLDIHVTGQNNRYTLREFNVGYADTVGEVRGIVDLNAQPPFVSLAGEAVALPLNTLGRDMGMDADVRGELTLRGGISSQGTDMDQLLGDLDGSLALALEDAEVQGAAYDLLATDLLAWFYTGASAKKSTHIDCTMAKFKLLNGVASSDSLYVETRRMVATGEAELDMVNQLMDVKITPRSKSRALQVPSSVRLKGKFDDPRTTVSPIAAAFDAYAEVLALVPKITRKLFGIKSRNKQQRPCEAVQ